MYKFFEALLKERGVTAYQVSKATGISTGSLTDWKKGRSQPKVDKLQKIADFFGVSVDYLLNGETEKPAVPKDDEPDVKETLSDMAKRAAQGALLMYDGEPLDAETQRAFEASLRVVIATLEGRKRK